MIVLTLTALAVNFAVMWWKARDRADHAESRLQFVTARVNVAERKAAGYREALEQSYVALQALAEKNLELEWVRMDGHVVQPGLWIGDQFIEVEPGEPGDIEVGQPIPHEPDPKPQFPHNGGARCWCGGEVGRREPGDEFGYGCLENITHEWLEGGPTRERFKTLPPEHGQS